MELLRFATLVVVAGPLAAQQLAPTPQRVEQSAAAAKPAAERPEDTEVWETGAKSGDTVRQ